MHATNIKLDRTMDYGWTIDEHRQIVAILKQELSALTMLEDNIYMLEMMTFA